MPGMGGCPPPGRSQGHSKSSNRPAHPQPEVLNSQVPNLRPSTLDPTPQTLDHSPSHRYQRSTRRCRPTAFCTSPISRSLFAQIFGRDCGWNLQELIRFSSKSFDQADFRRDRWFRSGSEVSEKYSTVQTDGFLHLTDLKVSALVIL